MKKYSIIITILVMCLLLTSCATTRAIMYTPDVKVESELTSDTEETIENINSEINQQEESSIGIVASYPSSEIMSNDESIEDIATSETSNEEFILVSSTLNTRAPTSSEIIDLKESNDTIKYIKRIIFNEDGTCVISGEEDLTLVYEIEDNDISIMEVISDETGTAKFLHEYLTKEEDHWKSQNMNLSSNPIDMEMVSNLPNIDENAWVYRLYYLEDTVLIEQDSDIHTNVIEESSEVVKSSKPPILIIIPVMVILLGVIILCLIAQWKLFAKAGEKGWKCLVPILNMWTIFKITYGEGIRMFLTWIPFAGFLFLILFVFDFAEAYGKKGIGFKLGLVLLAPIFFTIMGLSKKIQYVGPKVKK